ncbi:hypothetical protein ZWY2020_020891 [Hordeum vulgare]|nr:hypothetical protein ZWY2020_020891 [Hordeum vulgare]
MHTSRRDEPRDAGGGRTPVLAWRTTGWAARSAAFGPHEQERPYLEQLEPVPAGNVVLLEQVAEVVVGRDETRRVWVLRRQLAPQAPSLPSAHVRQLPLQL